MKKIIVSIMAAVVLTGCGPVQMEFNTGGLAVGISDKGQIVKLLDSDSDKDYLAKNQPAPLLQIRKQNVYYQPVSARINHDNGLIELAFPDSTTANIRVEQKESHLVFTLDEITDAGSLDLVVWGPYPTIIGETIGETVGVVRDSAFAIGIQALNLKTLGGFPSQESDIEPAYDIFESNNLIDVVDSVKVIYRGQTAKKEAFGSVIQAYCRNRNRERVISNWNHDYYVAPAFEDGGVTGSSIALFGCRAAEALATIGEIEIAEGLPHPVIDGEWGKTAGGATAAYLIMNFGIDDFEDALALTKKAGLQYLYHEGPFETWGHFRLHQRQFPENWETIRLMVQRASEEGIRIGVHTLSNFITTNDPYVTPVPDPRLAKVGGSTLVKAIGREDQTIEITDPKFFNQMKNNTLHAVVVDSEIIRYKDVTTTAPWHLLDCRRGAFGTTAADHQAGTVISKLMDHGYQTFLTDNELSEEVALRIADFINQTGCLQISFDGLEGNWSTGMGQYGRQRFTQIWYDHLRDDLKGRVITDASNPGHFFWHIYTRMNWGEPWYAGFRESQTQYRLLNQLYFQRNLMPAMLGWFRMTPETSVEDIEWLLARSAGFDAGYALVTSPAAARLNGFGDRIFETVEQWERARMAKAFPEEIKQELRDIRREFHLEANGPNNWHLFPYTIWRAEHTAAALQPGQPNITVMEADNPNPDQPLQFVLSAGDDNALENITISIDETPEITLPLNLPAGHHIKYTGGSYIHLHDQNWQVVETGRLVQKDVTLTQGAHTIRFAARFSSAGTKGGVKIEMKTAGLPHSI